MLRLAGANVWRVGFNAGDRAFWFQSKSFIPYTGTTDDWPARFAALIDEKYITDIVIYGDTRGIHATAIAHARCIGLRVHVFEEGYMRPYWVTSERGGANGHSRLMDMTIPQMRKVLENYDMDTPVPPAKWGALSLVCDVPKRRFQTF
jgi:capsular polysaccharide export protein